MAFSDPTTITISTVGKTLNKINQDNFGSEYLYRSSTEEVRLRIRHQNESAKVGVTPFERHNLEMIHTVFAVAPAVVNTERRYSFTARVKRGDDPASALASAKGLIGFLTDANVTKAIGWES
nr:MAG: putative coat protein [Leviviridae sp.]